MHAALYYTGTCTMYDIAWRITFIVGVFLYVSGGGGEGGEGGGEGDESW